MKRITPVFFPLNRRKTSKVFCGLMLLLIGTQTGWGQVALPHYDGIDYTVGESITSQTGWTLNQSATGDMAILEGSLTFDGLAPSTGNKIGFAGGGEDAIKIFTQVSSGKVYYSYLLNVTDVSSATGYFAGLLNNAVATGTGAPGSGSIGATIWVKPSANAGFFNIGFSARANQTTVGEGATNLQYGTVDYPIGTAVFLVASYEMVDGSGNDICTMWVNPVPGAAEPAATFTVSPSTDLSDISGFFIKQNGNSSTPGVEMDEMRFGLTWADVTPPGVVAVVTPTLVADITDTTVDNNIDITFTEDAAWRAAVTEVKVNGTTLTAVTDYELTAGNLQLKPSGLNALLTVPGSKAVTVVTTGYDDAAVTQDITVGMPTVNSTAVISDPLLPGMTSTVTVTAKDQYNNPVAGYIFKYDVTVVNNISTVTESYMVDGVAQTASANDVSVTAVTNAGGVATFTVTLPALVDSDDGINIQVQLNDGTTNIGTSFEFNQLTAQSITFGALSPVTYGAANFNLAASASSSLPVSYTSSNPAVATVTMAGVVTIVGVGTTTITASQAGNGTYNAASNVSQQLVVNCAPATATLSGTTTVCSGSGANLQVSITALVPQQYTVVYSDGTTNYTVSNYTGGTSIPVTPTATTSYSLVSVSGTNPNICSATNSGSATVSVTTTAAPSGSETQAFTTNDPVFISNLEADGTAVVWYASEADALSGSNPLASNFQVTGGATYYAMQTADGCTSIAPLAVTVSITLGREDFNLAGLKCYPNPTEDVLTIAYSDIITKIQIYNTLGQVVFTAQPNTVNPVISLKQLPASNYFMQVEANGSVKVLKILKR